MDISKLRIGFIGLGLMGGSFAKAIGKLGPKAIYAYDTCEKTLQSALKTRTIDYIVDIETMIEKCDVIVFGVYPKLEIEFLKRHFKKIKRKIILTDLSGLKSQLIEELLLGNYENIDFIAVHPMTGKEINGYENSSADLFVGSSVIFTTYYKNTEESFQLISSLYKSIGAKTIVQTTPAAHDQMIAYTSHLPHLLAVALCMDDIFPYSKDYIGKSFKDISRLANINENLWTELFISNGINNIENIDKLIHNLKALQNYISKNDYSNLHDSLKLSRLRKEEVNNDSKS